MKRLISLLLLGALLLGLLGGCAVQPVPTEPETAPATEPEPTLQPPKNYTVTPGGLSIKTDYSGYTAKKPTVTPRFTRLSDAEMPELTARTDYGALYPYIGAETEMDYASAKSYGFADANGRLVTDPVYSSVRQVQNSDGTQRVWIFQKVQLSEFVGDDGVRYPSADTICGFAAPDGSFATDCRYAYLRLGRSILMGVYPDGDDTAPVRFDVYDYTGALLATSDELPYADRLGFDGWRLDCVGDLLVVPLRNGLFEDWGDGQREQTDLYLFTLDGEQTAGPIDYIFSRVGDYFCVMQNDESSAVLRTDGSLLFGRSFYSVSIDTPDRFTVKDNENDDYHVLDAEGNEIFTIPGTDYLYWEGSCYYHVTQDGTYENGTLLDRNGAPVERLAGGEWFDLSGTGVFYRSERNGPTVVRSLKTEQEMTLWLGENDYIAPCAYNENADFRFFLVATEKNRDDFERMDIVVYNDRLEAVLRFYGSCTTVYDAADETPYLVTHTESGLTIYDRSMTPLFTVPGKLNDALSINAGALTSVDERACYVYDATGQLLICYPLYTLLDD